MIRLSAFAACLLAAPSTFAAPISLECTIAVEEGGKSTTIGQPKASTVVDRPIEVKSTAGAGPGQPGVTLELVVTPRKGADGLFWAGVVAIETTDGASSVSPIQTKTIAEPITARLALSKTVTYTVSCASK